MNYPVILTFMLVFSLSVNAQENDKCFGYDNAGNRISAGLCVKSAGNSPGKGDEEVVDNPTEEYQKMMEQVAEWRVYPNPASDALYLDLNRSEGIIEVLMLDLSGRVVLQQQLSENNLAELDVSMLKSGEYILEVRAAGNTRTWSILKND